MSVKEREYNSDETGPVCSDKNQDKQLQRLISLAIEQGSEGIAIVDLGGYLIYSNKAFALMHGYSPDELTGNHLSIFHNAKQMPSVDKANQQIIETGEFKGEIWRVRRDSTVFPSMMHNSLVRNEDGEPIGILGTLRDISDKKRAEVSLQTEKNFSKNLLETANTIVLTLDKNADITSFNKFAEKLTGYEKNEVLGRNLFEMFIPERDRVNIPEVFVNALKQMPEVSTYENAIITKSGEERLISWSNNAIKDEKGNISGLLSIGMDITDRRKVEDALLKNEKKFRGFINNAPIGIYTIDIEGNVTYGNKALYNMSGHKIDGWLGKSFKPVVHPDDLLKVIKMIEGSKNRQRVSTPYEIRIFNAAGEIMWVEVTSEALFEVNENNEELITGFQSFVKDITERKLAESERERLEIQLRQAQKMESLGTLAGGIAHDFNNILFPIIGYAEMLLEDFSDNPDAKRYSEEILGAAGRARELIQQILAFSRQSAKEFKPLSIQLIIKEVLKLLRASIPTFIEIRQNIYSQCRMVMSDPVQIHQVMMNLCTNAYHAMQESGGILEVSLCEVKLGVDDIKNRPGMKPGGYARISVSDTGNGIDPDTLGRIFDPYFTTKEPGKGTGLGLSVSHGIVKAHGGDIYVNSEKDKGTNFYVYLPLIESVVSEIKVGFPEAAIHGKERILLVDDEEHIADLLEHMLKRLGYHVTARTSSIEALNAFRFDPDGFDLVLSDMTMPNMTGDRLAQKIFEMRPGIPVILCTGFSERITDETLKIYGVRDIIMKPVIIKELGKAIRRVLDEKDDI